jgi:hypothetical protein
MLLAIVSTSSGRQQNYRAQQQATKSESFDIALILLLLQQLQTFMEDAVQDLETLLHDHILEQRRLNRSLPFNKQILTS